MASVATSNITALVRSILGGYGTGLQLGGAPVAAFRIASGQTPGDTAVLAPPAEFGSVRAAIGPVTDNLPTSGTGATNVTVTLVGGTTTVGQWTVLLIGNPI